MGYRQQLVNSDCPIWVTSRRLRTGKDLHDGHHHPEHMLAFRIDMLSGRQRIASKRPTCALGLWWPSPQSFPVDLTKSLRFQPLFALLVHMRHHNSQAYNVISAPLFPSKVLPAHHSSQASLHSLVLLIPGSLHDRLVQRPVHWREASN